VDRFHFVGRVHPAILYENGKVGAEQSAEPAVDAQGVIDDHGGMVAFGVGVLGHDQSALRAELDTKAASLAPFLNDVDDAVGHLDAVSIQRLSPKCHDPSSIPR
jgi:hypothetical protein